jgi:hypothetical protein
MSPLSVFGAPFRSDPVPVFGAPFGFGPVPALAPGVSPGPGLPMVPWPDQVLGESDSRLIPVPQPVPMPAPPPVPALSPVLWLAPPVAEGLCEAPGLGEGGQFAGHVRAMLKEFGCGGVVPVTTALALSSVAPAVAMIHALLVPVRPSIPPAAGAESVVSATRSPFVSKLAVIETN